MERESKKRGHQTTWSLAAYSISTIPATAQSAQSHPASLPVPPVPQIPAVDINRLDHTSSWALSSPSRRPGEHMRVSMLNQDRAGQSRPARSYIIYLRPAGVDACGEDACVCARNRRTGPLGPPTGLHRHPPNHGSSRKRSTPHEHLLRAPALGPSGEAVSGPQSRRFRRLPI
jgi:hypothetical protein